MLTGIHFLLTYTCIYECDHCFLHCSPNAQGTFTVAQIRSVLDEAVRIGTVESVYFEGGEPFLFHPLLVEAVRLARERKFRAGIVTNGYWATAREDARLWLKPLAELGIDDLSVSDDSFHTDIVDPDRPARHALAACRDLGLPTGSICIEEPSLEPPPPDSGKGLPVIAGGAKFRGRAVDKLTEGLPRRPWDSLVECPHEELRDPGRVHVDPLGHVHLCQGLAVGNMWETPLSELVARYDPDAHPVCGPLLKGGPAELVRAHGLDLRDGYVDECHLCYLARRALIARFPGLLAPRQVYAL